MQIGFIGLGQMGLGMARNLLASHTSLVVFDHDQGAVQQLGDAQPVTSPREMAHQCDVIFLCVPNDVAVRQVIWGQDGIATAEHAVSIIDTTTLDIEKCRAIGEEAEAAGLTYVDCPVSGMPPRAETGTLTSLFGGTGADYDRLSPLIRGYSQEVIHCGALGSGQLAKAVNNIIYDINIAAICEVLPLGLKAGLSAESLMQIVMGGSAASAAGNRFIPKIAARDFTQDFSMNDAYKDIENIQKTALKHHAMTPVVNAMVGTYQQAILAGHGDAPKSSMIKQYEAALGVTFQTKD